MKTKINFFNTDLRVKLQLRTVDTINLGKKKPKCVSGSEVLLGTSVTNNNCTDSIPVQLATILSGIFRPRLL